MRHSLRQIAATKKGVSGMWQTAVIYGVVMGAVGGSVFFGVHALRSGGQMSKEEMRAVQVQSAPAKVHTQVAVDAKLPKAQDQMRVPFTKDIWGKWFTKFKEHSIVEITLSEQGVYELIYTSESRGRLREYSRGKFVYNDRSGSIKLYPDLDMGEPAPIPGVAYELMTSRNYELLLRQDGNATNDLYLMALDSQRISRRFHPMFSYADFVGAPVLKFVRLGQN